MSVKREGEREREREREREIDRGKRHTGTKIKKTTNKISERD